MPLNESVLLTYFTGKILYVIYDEGKRFRLVQRPSGIYVQKFSEALIKKSRQL